MSRNGPIGLLSLRSSSSRGGGGSFGTKDHSNSSEAKEGESRDSGSDSGRGSSGDGYHNGGGGDVSSSSGAASVSQPTRFISPLRDKDIWRDVLTSFYTEAYDCRTEMEDIAKERGIGLRARKK